MSLQGKLFPRNFFLRKVFSEESFFQGIFLQGKFFNEFSLFFINNRNFERHPLSIMITFDIFFAITVQQIENHGNKHWAHYAGLVESDER
jgi:hypothetical protein